MRASATSGAEARLSNLKHRAEAFDWTTLEDREVYFEVEGYPAASTTAGEEPTYYGIVYAKVGEHSRVLSVKVKPVIDKGVPKLEIVEATDAVTPEGKILDGSGWVGVTLLNPHQ